MSRSCRGRSFASSSVPVVLAAVSCLWAGTSRTAPSGEFKTIAQAMAISKPGDTVLVGDGLYKERLLVEPGVSLVSKSIFGAVLDGDGRLTVLTLVGNGTVSGFEIRNGTIGVFSRGMGNSIIRCRIAENWQAGVICVGHLPRIEDNVIVFNKGSGIQGWKVHATVSAAISHNTISYNTNNGIAVGGPSDLALEDNIIALNDQFGLKVSDESPKIRMTGNDFYGNGIVAMSLPVGNVASDPVFIDPKKMNFQLAPQSPCRAQGEVRENLGARLTY